MQRHRENRVKTKNDNSPETRQIDVWVTVDFVKKKRMAEEKKTFVRTIQ